MRSMHLGSRASPSRNDRERKIGDELARNLIEAAEKSVGAHHSEPYRLRIKYLCEDLVS
jgi:hypothetical protein